MLRRAVRFAGAVGVVIAALVSMPGTAHAARSQQDLVEASARVGDCAEPTEGVTCHFVSAGARKHFVQLELTTIEVQDGRQIYTSDILCNVDRANVRWMPKAQEVRYRSSLSTGDCEVLLGDEPMPIDVELVWTAPAPLAEGSNDCSFAATIDGVQAPTTSFCDIIASGHGRGQGSSG